jgi:hypothetical protein
MELNGPDRRLVLRSTLHLAHSCSGGKTLLESTIGLAEGSNGLKGSLTLRFEGPSAGWRKVAIMDAELNYDELRYDPLLTRAALRPNGDDWYVWLEHADGTPVHLLIFTHEEVARAVGEDQLSEDAVVVEYIEQRLVDAGYSAVLEDGPLPRLLEGGPLPRPFIGAWTLGPPKGEGMSLSTAWVSGDMEKWTKLAIKGIDQDALELVSELCHIIGQLAESLALIEGPDCSPEIVLQQLALDVESAPEE